MAEAADELDRLIDEWFEGEVQRQWRLLDGFAGAILPEGADADERRELDRRLYAEDAERTLERLAGDYAQGRFGAGRPGARSIAARLSTPIPEDGQRFAALSKQVMEALGAILEARFKWIESAVEYRPQRPGAPAERSNDTAAPARPPMHRRPEGRSRRRSASSWTSGGAGRTRLGGGWPRWRANCGS